MWSNKRIVGLVIVFMAVPFAFSTSVSSARFSSTSYVIDASVMNNFGGQGSSSNYQVVGTGGESIIGDGTGGSYKLGAGFAAQLQKSFRMAVEPSGLMALYPLDETSLPRIYDNSVNAVNGTTVSSPTSVAGKLTNALSFNGSSQYATIGSTTSLQGTEFTLEAWVKTSTGGATMAVVSKGSNFWLGLNFGKAAIYDWTGATTCTAATPTVSDGSWHHIAATLVSGTTNGSIIYVDGVQQQTCTWTPAAQNGEVGIGASKAGSWQQYFNGQIDNVKVFNRAMNASEIKADYDGQNGGNASGVSLGTVTPGTSNITNYDAIVLTDAGGYTLSINQNQNLTNGGNTIPAVSGSIASPVTWSEGTTKGLGFTLFGTNATAIPGKWSSGNAYAALPGSSTAFYTRTGYSGGSSDYLNMRLRLDTAPSQASGVYTNQITTTGTLAP